MLRGRQMEVGLGESQSFLRVEGQEALLKVIG